MQDNLPQLRDIHIPQEDISFFPPAYGWWVILIVLILSVISFYLVRFILQKSKKRYALKILTSLEADNLSSAVKISELLRRICVYKYKNATTLYGKEWIKFLNEHSKTQITGKSANLLLNAPYMDRTTKTYDKQNMVELYRFCYSWIGENL